MSGRALGYIPLPSFPAEPCPSALRDPAQNESSDGGYDKVITVFEYTDIESSNSNVKIVQVNKLFYSKSDESTPADSDEETSEEDGSDSGAEKG